MTSEHFVEYELRCCQCGYDLRTISFNRSCPECGFSVMLTACDIAERVKSIVVGFVSSAQLNKLVTVAANTSYRLDQVTFLSNAHDFVIEARRTPRDPPSPPGKEHVNARELCLAVRDLARIEFGSAARDKLDQWQLATNQDVGRLVGQMIKYGAMKPSPGESEEDFSSPQCPNPGALDTT